MDIEASLLKSADWWFNVSWYGLMLSGAIAALASFATVAFLFIQFWSTNIRDRHSDFRTSNLELQAAEARRATAVANEKIRELDLSTADANARLAEANQKAEEERLARVKLEVQIAPRALTADMTKSLINALSGKFDFITLLIVDEAEPNAFAQQIISALTEAKIKVTVFTIHRIPVTSGLVLFGAAGPRFIKDLNRIHGLSEILPPPDYRDNSYYRQSGSSSYISTLLCYVFQGMGFFIESRRYEEGIKYIPGAVFSLLYRLGPALYVGPKS